MKKILFSALLSTAAFAEAQQLTPFVVASAGSQFSVSAGSLDWTLGEIMAETYSQADQILTQGFQQPAVVRVTGIEEKEETPLVYPNPVRDRLQIKTPYAGDVLIELFTINGVKLTSHKLTQEMPDHAHELDVKDYAPGLYLLRVTDMAAGSTSIFKIERQ